jgi:hypothetical protein
VTYHPVGLSGLRRWWDEHASRTIPRLRHLPLWAPHPGVTSQVGKGGFRDSNTAFGSGFHAHHGCLELRSSSGTVLGPTSLLEEEDLVLVDRSLAWRRSSGGPAAAEKIAAIVPRPQQELVVPRGAYESIALGPHEDIGSGRLQPGDQLPTLVELAAEFTVAVGTAQRAITLLAEEGLIDVTRGRRAVVCRRLKPVAG